MSSWAKWRKHAGTTLAVLALSTGAAITSLASGPAGAVVAASGGNNTYKLSGAVNGTLSDGPNAGGKTLKQAERRGGARDGEGYGRLRYRRVQLVRRTPTRPVVGVHSVQVVASRSEKSTLSIAIGEEHSRRTPLGGRARATLRLAPLPRGVSTVSTVNWPAMRLSGHSSTDVATNRRVPKFGEPQF